MSAETFGAMLKRLRQAKTVTIVKTTVRGRSTTTVSRTVDLSQSELAFRAGMNPAAVVRLEAGGRIPKRETVTQLAEALEVDQAATDRLLIASGYWPWDLDDEQIAVLIEHVRTKPARPTPIRSRAG